MKSNYAVRTNPALNVINLMVGLLIGSAAGAIAMFLLAPQSGKKTRKQIQQKSMELVEQTTEMVEDAVTQARKSGKKLSKGSRQIAQDILDQGQSMVAGKMEIITDAVKAGKKAIQSS